MKLETSVKVYFDDVQDMIDEIQRLQTYKLFEGDTMGLVDLDAVVAIMANHVKADKCSESPNSWIPCSERLPELDDEVLVTDDGGELRHCIFCSRGETWCGFVTYEEGMSLIATAWMPLPEPWKGADDEID